MARTKVFVSYSRHDEGFVRPLAGILGIATDDAIFLDVASIKPGDRWQDDIDGALQEASVFIFCWCCQAQKSQPIGHEIAMALQGTGKRLVPVLLCPAPLPPALAAYQWIDLQGAVKHECEHSAAPAAPASMVARGASAPVPKRSAKSTKYVWLVAVSAVGIMLVSLGVGHMRKGAGAPAPAQVTIIHSARPEQKGVVPMVVEGHWSPLCAALQGPRKGQTFSISESGPVGGRCEDGAGSIGVIVREAPRVLPPVELDRDQRFVAPPADSSAENEARSASPPSSRAASSTEPFWILAGAALVAFIFLLATFLHQIVRRRRRAREAERIASTATEYFRALRHNQLP
jgi:hypothetical protein